jgi:lipopolysaccharide/colanic/teichoic acid biosynthesis glycosyltransferase
MATLEPVAQIYVTASSSASVAVSCGRVPKVDLVFKRILDIVSSILVMLHPESLPLFIAIAIEVDACGPVFYTSKRIGKIGRAFRCMRFRNMVHDAGSRRVDVMQLNANAFFQDLE